MINITDIAKEKLQSILAEHPGKYVRIAVEGIG